MIAHALARRILEADDDLDINGEVQRLSGTSHPGVEIEVEGNHWNVYRIVFEDDRRKQGSIYYSDPKDLPPDMSPENRAMWSQYSWDAIPLSPHVDGQFFKTFDEAVKFLANIKWVGEAKSDVRSHGAVAAPRGRNSEGVSARARAQALVQSALE